MLPPPLVSTASLREGAESPAPHQLPSSVAVPERKLYFSLEELEKFMAGEGASNIEEDRRHFLPVIMWDFINSDGVRSHAQTSLAALEQLVLTQLRAATTRDQASDILGLILEQTSSYRDWIRDRVRDELTRRLRLNLVTSGKHDGSYRGVRRAHDLLWLWYMTALQKEVDAWMYYRTIPISAIAAAMALARRLFQLHLRHPI